MALRMKLEMHIRGDVWEMKLPGTSKRTIRKYRKIMRDKYRRSIDDEYQIYLIVESKANTQ
jgi:hypothetical protein